MHSVYIQYRTDGSLFNPRRLHRKTLEQLFRELLGAEAAGIVPHDNTDRVLQFIIIASSFAELAQLFSGLEVSCRSVAESGRHGASRAQVPCARLEVSLKKTKVLRRPLMHLGMRISTSHHHRL